MAASVAIATGLLTPGSVANARCVAGNFLSIDGKPSSGDEPRPVRRSLSEAQLLGLPSASITTGTEWTPRSRFDGPLLSDVLTLAKVRGKSIRLFALNDYSVTIPWSDMERYGIILALSQNGERLSNRRFGPLFLMYPRDQFALTLDTSTGAEKFIWQVCSIHVQ